MTIAGCEAADIRPGLISIAATLLAGFVALGLLTHVPGSLPTVILVVASGVALIGFVVGIVAMELRVHRPKRNEDWRSRISR